MHNNIIFIGGIHGSGKGTICTRICQKLNIEHLTASEILNWSEISSNVGNKFVTNIPSTQHRLILGLKNRILPNKKYILDGHFCLFNSEGEVENIQFETFFIIDPILVSVVICDPTVIVQRLNFRDGKFYDLELIAQMQTNEIEYGSDVAKKLNKPFIIVEKDESLLIQAINPN